MFKIFPNPIANDFEISYSIPDDDRVSLSIYNSNGKLVATLFDQLQKAGNYRHSVGTKSLNLSNGIYFVRFSCGEKVLLQKALKAE